MLTDREFEQEFLAQLPRLKSICKRIAKAEWEDLMQDTTVLAFRFKSSYDPGSNMGGWLHVIARNQFHAQGRRSVNRNKVSFDEAMLDRLTVQPGQFNSFYARQVLREAERLPEDLQVPLMQAILGASVEEVATLVNCVPSTAKVRLHRARYAMAERMGEQPRAKSVR